MKLWEKRASDPQPFVSVTYSFYTSDKANLGVPTDSKSRSAPPLHTTTHGSMADTGCQSCLSGVSLLRKLKLSPSDLVPAKTRMNAANSNPINILGALPLRITGTAASGETVETRQLVYFTDSTTNTYLSRQACVALGIISQHFPQVGETLNVTECANATGDDNATATHAHREADTHADSTPTGSASGRRCLDDKGRELAECGCLKRTPPPPPPSSPPVPAT